MAYGNSEAGFGFKQIWSAPKASGGGTGMAYGDLVWYDTATNNWKKGTSAAVKKFGFCGETKILTQVLDVITNITTSTRGAADAETEMSVVVAGRQETIAEGVIRPFRYVMPGSTNPLRVKEWDGVSRNTIIGQYVINVTQFHNPKAVLPSTADGDAIKIDFPEA